MATKRFIQGAIKRPGALTAKANAVGMSINAYARAHQHDSGLSGQQSRFYLHTLKPAAASARRKAVVKTLKKS